eukprot:1350841-Prymnesium_polylepis.1
MEEVKRWEKLPYERYEAFYDNEGRELALALHTVLNEFAMMYAIRYSYPLHYTVFKQYTSHPCRTRPTSSSSSRARAT